MSLVVVMCDASYRWTWERIDGEVGQRFEAPLER